MARLFSPVLAVLPTVLALVSCEPVSMIATGATFVSVIQSEETVTDKALSWALDKRCSIFQVARGEQYCQKTGPDIPEQYCYRTLGSITCYAQPDPNASPEVAVFAKPPEPMAPPVLSSNAPSHARLSAPNRVPAH